MGLFNRLLGVLAITAVVAGCANSQQSQDVIPQNLVQVSSAPAAQTIGDETNSFTVLRSDALAKSSIKLLPNKDALAALAKLTAEAGVEVEADDANVPAQPPVAVPLPEEEEEQLLLGFPINLVEESQVFGAVITKVSAKDSELLGRLKLTDLTPLHVRTIIAKASETQYVLGLLGCVNDCSEASEQRPILALPILGVDEQNKTVVVDLAELGKSLNLVQMLDPDGNYTQLKTKSAKTVAFDYSLSTLVFDIETTMIPKDATDPATAQETVFTARWYLRLASVFDSSFEARTATDGVGFFQTERAKVSHIQRFSRAGFPGVRYFVKNVPTEHQPAFKAAFDNWNATFKKETGRELISYTFVNADDPRAEQIVAGDIRFNVVEWDLNNLAPYGGLGPSIANQYTGQILSANVLVQGPKIVEIYSKWFKVSRQIEDLEAAGRHAEAQKLARDFSLTLKKIATPSKRTLKLTLGKDLTFRIPAQIPALQDPLMEKLDFEPIPAGFTFEKYMFGYFQELVGHELGHNVGLRHNFRGNLYSTDTMEEGTVSTSIMEYLGRGFRHLNRIGEYDVMAIRYGYLGEKPKHLGRFCTDEDVPSPENLGGSPECSRDDATSDPFAYFTRQLKRAVDLLINRESTEAPVWTAPEMEKELNASIGGMGLYAASAEVTGTDWTHFFTGGERPKTPDEVPAFVLAKVKSLVCDATIADVVAQKESEEAKEKVNANLKALTEKVHKTFTSLNLGPDGLGCETN